MTKWPNPENNKTYESKGVNRSQRQSEKREQWIRGVRVSQSILNRWTIVGRSQNESRRVKEENNNSTGTLVPKIGVR